MAPELRARKSAGNYDWSHFILLPLTDSGSAASLKQTTPKSKDAAPVKRKAAEDASPVVTKKTKAVKADSAAKKGSKKQPTEPTIADEERPVSDDEQDNDQALALAGVSDSEDDAVVDDKAAFKEGQDVGEAPVASKAVEKAGKSSRSGKEDKAVVYIGRIPHGFFERQMHEYFGQFGEITRLRLSRNKKTGQSKHFAFIEFAEESTAEYVAKSMNNVSFGAHIKHNCKMRDG